LPTGGSQHDQNRLMLKTNDARKPGAELPAGANRTTASRLGKRWDGEGLKPPQTKNEIS